MKKVQVLVTALSLLLVLLLTGSMAFAASTTASVSFEEGELEFGELDPESGVNSMNIQFGLQTLPVGPTTYVAKDGLHVLTVLDARASGNAGNWAVTASLSDFTSGTVSTTFGGTITLKAPQADTGLTATNPLALISGASPITVVTAEPGLNSDTYNTAWNAVDAAQVEDANVTLSIDAAAAAVINDPAAFQAVITWTLTDA